jgi:pimeloyl-ACP methyl ester carboxylesterase
MDQVGFAFLVAGAALLALATIWFFVVGFRVKWWWVLAFFLVIPVFVFAVVHRRRLRVVGLLLLTSLSLEFLGLIVAGDLFHDNHPDEPPTRTFVQRALGCSGSAVWSQLSVSKTKPLEDWLKAYTLNAAALGTEIGVSLLAVHAAALSYLAPARMETIGGFGVSDAKITALTIGAHQAVVFATDYIVVVAFRGTDNSENWVKNFKFVPAQSTLGSVHSGFRDGFQALWPSVTRALALARDKNQPIWLAGHSLGGAIAVLTAVELQKTRQEVAGIVTFGQPPVGYPAFTERFEATMPKRLVRYVNHRDAVVEAKGLLALPWTELTHMGVLRYFDTTGRLHPGRPSMLQLTRDGVCAPSFEGGAEFGAHYIRRYLDLVLNESKRSRQQIAQ